MEKRRFEVADKVGNPWSGAVQERAISAWEEHFARHRSGRHLGKMLGLKALGEAPYALDDGVPLTIATREELRCVPVLLLALFYVPAAFRCHGVRHLLPVPGHTRRSTVLPQQKPRPATCVGRRTLPSDPVPRAAEMPAYNPAGPRPGYADVPRLKKHETMSSRLEAMRELDTLGVAKNPLLRKTAWQ